MRTPTVEECTLVARELLCEYLRHLVGLERLTSHQHYRTLTATEILKLLVRGDEVPTYQAGDLLLGDEESCAGWLREITHVETEIVQSMPAYTAQVMKSARALDMQLDPILTRLELAAGVKFAHVRKTVQELGRSTTVFGDAPGLRHAWNLRRKAQGFA